MKDYKGKVSDLLSAFKEEGVSAFLESEAFGTIANELVAKVISSPAAPLVGSLLGAVAPRINGAYISYKQHRFERNIKRLIGELSSRIDVLEENYRALNEYKQKEYQDVYIEMLLDSIVDERQEEKIKMGVSGFISLMNNDSNENIMQIFFDTLTELTVLDIDTLKMYSFQSDTNWKDIEKKYGIDADRIKLVKEKLVRYGLLSRKNDIIRDNNQKEIVDYLKACEADSKRKNPHGVKLSSKVKKVEDSESYRITTLGNGFLRSIGKI